MNTRRATARRYYVCTVYTHIINIPILIQYILSCKRVPVCPAAVTAAAAYLQRLSVLSPCAPYIINRPVCCVCVCLLPIPPPLVTWVRGKEINSGGGGTRICGEERMAVAMGG